MPTHRDGKLYGRGAADMKTSIAAMVAAIEEFVAAHPAPARSPAAHQRRGRPGVDGTVVVCEQLRARGERLDYCIVGEPTSVERLGDMIKNGRRGSLTGKLTVKGMQGHIAYPQLARNPIHLALPALAELAATEWDRGNDFFPPTSWQMSQHPRRHRRGQRHPGRGGGRLQLPLLHRVARPRRCSSACMPSSTGTARLRQLAWTVGGQPFLTTPGELVEARAAAIREETGLETELSTTGGTSDGRFIARICPQVIEFGPVNASIHKIDEHVAVADIEPLKNIYRARWRTWTRCDADRAGRATAGRPPRSRGGRFVWARHDQCLRRGRLAGAVALGLPLDELDARRRR